MAELAAVPVGHRRVADVVVAWRELARGALEEERRRSEGRLQHLARGADVVRREEPVLPRERRRVAGVVEERREHAAVGGRRPADENGVVGGAVRVVAAGEPLGLGVPEVPVRREPAAAGAVRDERLRHPVARLDDGVGDLCREVLEVRRDQLRAGLALEAGVRVRARVRVRHLDQDLRLAEAGALHHRRRSPPARPARTGTSRCRARRAPASARRLRAVRRRRRSPSAADALPPRRRASRRPTSGSRSRPAASRRAARPRRRSACSCSSHSRGSPFVCDASRAERPRHCGSRHVDRITGIAHRRELVEEAMDLALIVA